MNVQKIAIAGGKNLVVLPEDEFNRILDVLEERADENAIRMFWEKLDQGEEEFIPSEIANRLIAGESPVKVWREYRGLSARSLSEQAGISPSYLSQMETGKRDGAISTYKNIAKALNVSVDDLI